MRKLPKHLIAILKKIHHLLHRQHQTQVWSLEPISSSQISLNRDYYKLGDPDDQLFIQPEAEEEVVTLPNNVLDRTVDLTYDQLPPFFDDLAPKVSD
jgi:hypothetical protein